MSSGLISESWNYIEFRGFIQTYKLFFSFIEFLKIRKEDQESRIYTGLFLNYANMYLVMNILHLMIILQNIQILIHYIVYLNLNTVMSIISQ